MDQSQDVSVEHASAQGPAGSSQEQELGSCSSESAKVQEENIDWPAAARSLSHIDSGEHQADGSDLGKRKGKVIAEVKKIWASSEQESEEKRPRVGDVEQRSRLFASPMKQVRAIAAEQRAHLILRIKQKRSFLVSSKETISRLEDEIAGMEEEKKELENFVKLCE